MNATGGDAAVSFKRWEREVVNPGRTRAILEVQIGDMALQLQNVSHGNRSAARIDAPALGGLVDETKRMMLEMMSGALLSMIQTPMAAGPLGAFNFVGQVLTLGAMGVATAKLQQMPIGKWQCQNTKATAKPPDKMEVSFDGAEKVGDASTRAYRISFSENGQRRQMRVNIADGSGLPLRIVGQDQTSHGQINVDYVDIDVPLVIDLPAC